MFPTLQRVTSARDVEYIQDTMRSRSDDDSRLVIRMDALDVRSDLSVATLHSTECKFFHIYFFIFRKIISHISYEKAAVYFMRTFARVLLKFYSIITLQILKDFKLR